jgi:transmembrane sensor
MKEADKLLDKYKAGTCSPAEKMLVEKWFHHLNENESSELSETDLSDAKEMFRRRVSPVLKRDRASLWPRMIAAAAVVIIISIGIHFYRNSGDSKTFVNTESRGDVDPGGNKATLTLANGSKISLTNASNGELARESGISIVKTADGQVIYKIMQKEGSVDPLSYNKIETPVGGQYQVNLPDGSKVWLNSSSSIRYPVRFTGGERKIEITGEAYFEVSHDASMPFRVVSAKQTVEVLGTSFNIMAYTDEMATSTTLIHGSVRVSQGEKSKVISPGQQTSVNDENINIKEADVEEAMAWKNGYFIFKSEDIHSIMRKISRWYNVKVEYNGDEIGKVFGGKISRSRKVSEVLKMLESTGSLHFKLMPNEPGQEGRLIVMP